MSATLLADVWLTARKEHRCSVCGGVIGRGDRYRRQRIVDGRDTGVWKAHRLCEAAYWKAYAEADLIDDETPDHEEIMPLVLGFFEAIARLR